MTSTTEEPKILRVDGRRRVHVPAARRKTLLDEYERSEPSAPEVARLMGIRYGTFTSCGRSGGGRGRCRWSPTSTPWWTDMVAR